MKDKLLKCSAILLVLIAFGLSSVAAVNSSYKFSYRSVPSALNFSGQFVYEELLWGKVSKERPFYGFYKVGAVVGGSPTLGAFIELVPVAPLVIKYQQSMTYRFLKSSVFDCTGAYCFGVLNRRDFSVQMAAGYGQIVGVTSYLWRKLNAPESSNPVVAEQELFTTTSGDHSYNELGVTIGYLLNEERVVGVHYTSAEISEGNRRSNSVYGIYHWKWSGLDLTTGAGRYESEQVNISGGGVFFIIGKKFGESLSLF